MSVTEPQQATDSVGVVGVVGVPTAPAARRSPTARRRWMKVAAPIAVFALFIGVWYLLALQILPEYKRFLVPPPHRVISVAFIDSPVLDDNLAALWLSTRVALFGFAIASMLGIAIAIAMSLAEWIELSLWPYAVALQCIPILALTPLIGALLGFGFNARVVVTVMFALFPIVSNTLFGLLSVDAGHHDLFTLAHVSRTTRMMKLQLPAAVPSIVTGMRISAGLAVIGAVVGDTFFRQGKPGIGALIDVYRVRLQGEQMIGCIIMAVVLGLVVFIGVGTLGTRATRSWHASTRR